MGVRSARSEQTRERILGAAKELFAVHGYKSVGVREIGRRAGLTNAALYYYFPSKRALYDAMLVLPDVADLQAHSRVAGRDQVHEIIFDWIDHRGDDSEVVSMVIAGVWHGDPEAISTLAQLQQAFLGVLRPALERHCGPEWELVARTILTSISGLVMQLTVEYGPRYIDKLRTPAGRQVIREILELALLDAPSVSVSGS
jgi:AcrR family transcriptional regulator